MFYKWINWLFEVTIEIDGHLNLLSTETIRFETRVYYKNVKSANWSIEQWEQIIKRIDR